MSRRSPRVPPTRSAPSASSTASTASAAQARDAADEPRPWPEDLGAPGPWLMMLEARAPWEAMALMAVAPFFSRLPSGDGHPVLIFPGLGASDGSTFALRRFIHQQGFTPYAWEQGFNLGPRSGVLDACRARIAELFERHGEPLSLVGWSLGGIYAREMAKEMPDKVRCVVTLGTPFAGHPRATNAWRFFELVSGQTSHDEALLAGLRVPPPVPTTSIFSKTDGVVAWPCSIHPPGLPLTENIEVNASHIGMGMNPMALYAVGDRLRQDPQHWRPFDVAGARRWFFKVALQPESVTRWY